MPPYSGLRLVRGLVSLEREDPRADVLVLTNMWPHAGNPAYGVFVKRQVDSLIEEGIRCDVLFVRGYRSPLAYLAAGLLLAWWNLHRPRPWRLVHAHGGETALPARAFVRAPLLVSYCGDDLLGTPRADGTITGASRIRRALLRLHSILVDATITKSREMETKLPRLRRRNAVVPNGVDRTLFAPLERTEARRLLGWDPDERVALFAADPAVERKRHWLALAAVQDAAARVGPVRLHVAVRVSPAEMPLVMSAADCLVLTSAIEGSPNVVKEALMCNLPVVSTDVGDVVELLDGVDPSWVCDADPSSLGAALAACLREPRRSNGRVVGAWLDQRAIAERVLALYESLAPGVVAGRSAPAQVPVCAG